MIIEQHYDEEVLIGLLEEPERDSHVPGCDTCAGTLESLRDLTGALRDDSVWDERPLSERPSAKTANMLRAFAERTTAEDAVAGLIVAKLLAVTPEERTALLAKNPQWRTAGVVRRLLKVVDDINYTDPKGAVDLTTLSVVVGESIVKDYYPGDSAKKLCATALREQAFALYFVGSFAESLAALERAQNELKDCKVADCENAEIDLLRARVYRDLERFDESRELARKAAAIFRRFGSYTRTALAEATEATVLVHLRRFRDALAIDSRLAADLSLNDE